MTFYTLTGDWNQSDYATYGASAIVMPDEFYAELEQQLSDERWVHADQGIQCPQWYCEYKDQDDKPFAKRPIPAHIRLASHIAAAHIMQQTGMVVAPVSTMCWSGAETMKWHEDVITPAGDAVDCQLLTYFGDTHTADTGGMVQFRTPAQLYAEHYPRNRSSVLHSSAAGYEHRPVAHAGAALNRILINYGFSFCG